MSRNVLAAGIVFSPKDVMVGVYLDRVEKTILRLQEEERTLKTLIQEQMLESLSGETMPEEALSLLEEKPKRSMFTASHRFLEDMFESAQLRTSIAATIKYDDNVKLTADDMKGDWIYTIRPALNLKLTRGQSYLGLDYSYTYDCYLEKTSRDTQTNRLDATLFYKPSNIFSFQLDEVFEGTGAVDLFKLAPFTIDRFNRSHDRVNASSLNTVFTYMPWGRTNLAHLTIGDARSYSTDHSLETTTQNFDVDIEHYLNPITSVYFGLGVAQTYNEAEASQDYENLPVLTFGLKYGLTNITTAEAKLTYEFSHYDDATDEEGYRLEFTLRHKISNFTDLSTTFKSGWDNTLASYRRYYNNELRATLNHQLTQKLSLSTNATYSWDDYYKEDYLGTELALDKQRRRYEVDFGLNHQLYKWLNLSFNYTHSRILSEFADESYRDNLYSWTARLDF